MVEKQKLIDLVRGRQAKLETSRAKFEDEWQYIADYIIPIREDIRGDGIKGARQGTKIFDGTAVNAAILATDGIHGYHVSPAFTWFQYMMEKDKLNDIHEIREWLQEVETVIYTALNNSNFYDEMWPFIYDGITIGTATMHIEEDLAEKKTVFESVHPGEVFVAENRYGVVDLLHRKVKLPHRKAFQMFGNDAPVDVKTAWRANPFVETEYLHAVFPREERDDRRMDSKNKKYASVWIHGTHLCRESGYDVFPYPTWRYARSGKESYGRSMASNALSDIIGLNLLSKTLLGAAQMHVDPPLNVPAELRDKVQWKPRGKNYYEETGRMVEPADTRSNYPAGVDREERKQRIIEKHFHVDFFLMLANLNAERGQRTAYEVSQLQEEKAAVLGAELAPLNKSLDHMLDYVYLIEVNNRRIPEPPDILLQLAGEKFNPIYLGPLAQAQRRLFGTQGLRAGLQAIGELVQARPETADLVDWDETVRKLLESSGFPQTAIRKDEDVAAMRQAREMAIQQQQQMQQMIEGTGALKNVASADKDMEGGIRGLIQGVAEGAANEA